MIPHQLRIFEAVAKQKGFNRASKYLRLSQPAISANIKKLEEELGIEIFEDGELLLNSLTVSAHAFQPSLETMGT